MQEFDYRRALRGEPNRVALLWSIQKSKAPKGDAVAVADFCIVNGQKTIVNVLDSLKVFLATADFASLSLFWFVNHKIMPFYWFSNHKIIQFYWFSNHKMINDSFLSWKEEAVGVDSGGDFVVEGFVGAFE